MLFTIPSSGQNQNKPGTYGIIKGIVTDSTGNRPLSSSSISVYKLSDSSVVNYLLSDGQGKFTIGKIPIGIELILVVSFVGYKNYKKNFSLSDQSPEMTINEIVLHRQTIDLKEVSITNYRAPVEMNGDTLEFNADAFKLDKNAVVEDLMRQLPGMTIWADGKITIHGKTVKSVLVDGKPFFGGETTVATQNLPKDAVDKIQVYSDRDEQLSPLDSLLKVNIKLKKNKNNGLFGKVNFGMGTDSRYAANGMISLFNPKAQISAVESSNNVNILSRTVDDLIKYSSFVGTGLNVSFQPDFNIEGTYRSHTGGAKFQYDFISNPTNYLNNRLDADLYINRNSRNLIRRDETINNQNNGYFIKNKNASDLNSVYNQKKAKSNYYYKKDRVEFYFSADLSTSGDVSNSTEYETSEDNKGPQSSKRSTYEKNYKEQYISIKNGYKNKSYNIDLEFSNKISENESVNHTEFTSFNDESQNSLYDRNYNNRFHQLYHRVNFGLDLKEFLFKNVQIGEITPYLNNELIYKKELANDVVTDFSAKMINKGLTAQNTYKDIVYKPSIGLSRIFSTTFPNRYRKAVLFSATFQYEVFYQRNNSDKKIQNFNNSYIHFTPRSSIYYTNDQFGDHLSTFKLEYKTSVSYLNRNQIAPLIDSANVYYLQFGNPLLKPTVKQEIIFDMTYASFHSRHAVDSYNLRLKSDFNRNGIIDSTIYDAQGRASNYFTNSNHLFWFNAAGDVNKSFKIKKNQMQISAKSNLTYEIRPQFINSELIKSQTLFIENQLTLTYSLKDLMALSLTQRYARFSSEQNSTQKNKLWNSTSGTALGTNVNFSKKISLSSNINHNINRYSNSNSSDFFIWNAYLNFRFFEGNQGELKFSALDLLGQNQGVINSGQGNSVTVRNVNLLQRYFMITLAYYPRKFGKSQKKQEKNGS